MEKDEFKPWEDSPTGPAPKNEIVGFQIDVFKIFRWAKDLFGKNKKEEKDDV